MGVKSLAAKALAAYVVRQQQRWSRQAGSIQQALLAKLLYTASNTAFGKAHNVGALQNHRQFTEAVPVRDYEALLHYFDRTKAGEADVLWPGKPLYLAKTSGTTSGSKYIPITRQSIGNHISGARNALLNYVHQTGNARFLDGKMMFLSGSPELEQVGGIPTGRLSGIVNHHVPAYLRSNQLPDYDTNCIEDWETKLDAIVKQTVPARMTLISGIPPWVQMYFDKLIAATGKPVKDIFPYFDLLVYGGVNFEPYRAKMMESIGRKIDTVELFPASEGFFAYQDLPGEEGMLLLLDSGIFYEFIPLTDFYSENPPRLTIDQVQLGVNYALVISSNAGLWAYSVGDTVKFVSLAPYRVVVTGRVKHFISAFGEHVIAEEVENALRQTLSAFSEASVTEFTVAPYISTAEEPSYHEWLIEFATPPASLAAFSNQLNKAMCRLNSYYNDLQTGNILAPLQVVSLPPHSFKAYMKQQGKLGGQNKVPRLSNTPALANALKALTITLQNEV